MSAALLLLALVTPSTSIYIDYDELGRVRARRGNHSQNVVYEYDLNGNLKKITDSLGKPTTLTYDALDRVATVTDAKAGVTTFSYDAADRLLSVKDPRNHTTSYVVDGFGQLWTQTSPDTGVTKFAYDATGLRTSMTRADLAVTTFGYDDLGRLTTITAGGDPQAFAYDDCTSGLGHLCSVTDPTGSVSYAYTPDGQISSQSSVLPASGLSSLAFSYDIMGRLASITYPNGNSASYSYAYGKPATVTATVGSVATTVVSNAAYEPSGVSAGWTYGNGLDRIYDYDSDGRKIGVATNTSTSPLQSLTYGFNANDAITTITNGVNANLTQNYGYDDLMRLTSVTATGADQVLTYDAVGNRISHTWNEAVDAYSTAAANNRLNAITGSRPKTFTLDVNGNVTAGAGTTYTYDAFNRMATATKAGVTATYDVNGLGQRIHKQIGTVNTWFVYEPGGSMVSEYKNGPGWTNYLWFNGEPVAMVRGGQIRYIHNDHLGRPELVTNSTKSVLWRASNFAFGRTVTLDSLGGLNIGFPGQYFDAETGNWNNGFRDYDASIGRYLQVDPLERYMPGANNYVYVRGNPVILIDPLGLDWQYSQGTGQLSHNGTPVGTGYAGHGPGWNNSAMQNVSGVGPLPQGTYTIGPQRNSPNTGPATMNLTPAPDTETYGRDAFRIHGDNRNGDNSASHGCIVIRRSIRDEIANSGDDTLVVGP